MRLNTFDPPVGPVPTQGELFNYMAPDAGFVMREAFTQGIESYHSVTAATELLDQYAGEGSDVEMTRDVWTEEYARPGLVFREDMNLAEARIEAERYDRDYRRSLIFKNAFRDWDTMLAGGAGMIASQILDPVNYIPIARWMTKGRSATSAAIGVGDVFQAGLATGTAGFVTEVARESIFALRDTSQNADYNVMQGALNVSLAFGVGMGFGVTLKGIAALHPSNHFAAAAVTADEIFQQGKTIPDGSSLQPAFNMAGSRIDSLPSVPTRTPSTTQTLFEAVTSEAETLSASAKARLTPEMKEAANATMDRFRRAVDVIANCLKGSA